jgi:hypothetical protein
LKEQIAHQYTKTGKPITQRRRVVTNQDTYDEELPTSQHRVGHSADLYPEDTSYHSSKMHQRRTVEDEALNEDEYQDVWPPRMPTSSRRYQSIPDVTTRNGASQIYRQGNKTFVVHDEFPPVRQRQLPQPNNYVEEALKPRRPLHWLVWVGVALFVMIVGWIGLSTLSSFIQTKQDDWTYGQTRHFTLDAVVGHNDSTFNPSHFIAENDKGDVYVIELPGGDASKAHIYQITAVPGNNGNPPVRLSFQDLNRDGKLDMLVQIGDAGNYITVILFNNGSQFVSKL